jgi:hypothetical protein
MADAPTLYVLCTVSQDWVFPCTHWKGTLFSVVVLYAYA